MVRLLGVLVLTSSTLLAFVRAAEPSDDELRKKPITTDGSEIGKLLQNWWKEGTAAGNVGDWYDNRDGEHSPLDLRPWPQLQKAHYTPADVKARRHWALTLGARPHVTFGNSSTSGPTQANGVPRPGLDPFGSPICPFPPTVRSSNIRVVPFQSGVHPWDCSLPT